MSNIPQIINLNINYRKKTRIFLKIINDKNKKYNNLYILISFKNNLSVNF